MVDKKTPIGRLKSEVLANEGLVVVNLDFFIAFFTFGSTLGNVEEFLVAFRKDGGVLVDEEGAESTTRHRDECIGSGLNDVGIASLRIE